MFVKPVIVTERADGPTVTVLSGCATVTMNPVVGVSQL